MKSSEIAKLAGVSVRTLRHYHAIDLLPEPPRGENGYRDYGAGDLVRLLRIKRQHQTAMVFISHDLNAISRVADRIAVLNQGQVVDRGSFQHILRHANDPYTKLLVEKRTAVMSKYRTVLEGRGLARA